MVANHLVTMVTFTKGPCSLGEKCVAPHADLCSIYKCKKYKVQLHTVVYHCGIPASEGGVPDAQGDSVVCHGCANMVKCASDNCVINKNKVATDLFCCMHDQCKKPVHASCVKALLQKNGTGYLDRRWESSLLLWSKTWCFLF